MDRLEENRELIRLFEPLRVVDVERGMEKTAYKGYGSLRSAIRPIVPDAGHRICGIARTARYIPFEGPQPDLARMTFAQWADDYFQTVATYPWIDDIEEGDILCVDLSGAEASPMDEDHLNTCLKRGARGLVTNGGSIWKADPDALGHFPVWCRPECSAWPLGTIRFMEANSPVALGGVAIYPGDVIVADPDGVISVPRSAARHVAALALSQEPEEPDIFSLDDDPFFSGDWFRTDD